MKFIIALIAFGTLLVYVQCKSKMHETEYEIKEGLLSGGRSYSIKSVSNAPEHFSIRNELFTVGKKLVLLENGKERYVVKHVLLSSPETWTIRDSVTGKEIGTIRKHREAVGSEMTATGEFGHYKISGKFLNHEFTIEKDGHKVAKIDKKRFHLHDTYGLTVYGDADRSLMVLFTVVVDGIREH